jgi:hypothetical protein
VAEQAAEKKRLDTCQRAWFQSLRKNAGTTISERGFSLAQPPVESEDPLGFRPGLTLRVAGNLYVASQKGLGFGRGLILALKPESLDADKPCRRNS